MANITGTWSYGKFVAYTASEASDDSETWSYGKVLSVLEYIGAKITSITFTFKKRNIDFELAKRSIDFNLN